MDGARPASSGGTSGSGQRTVAGPLVIGGFALAVSLTILILGGLVWYTRLSYRHWESAETLHYRIAELSGEITHIDEVLTMSARMVAATGEARWEARYRSFEPQLDAAIKEARKLAPELSEAISQTDVANVKLVEMENKAFELVRGGDLEGATDVLYSAEYENQKRIYSSGIAEVTERMRASVQAKLDEYRRVSRVTIAALVVAVGLVALAWVAAFGTLRRYISERKRAELALRMSEQCFRAIADYTYFWEIWVSPGGRPLWTNPAVERVTGYDIKEFMSGSEYLIGLVCEEDKDRVGRALRSALGGSTGKELVFRMRRKDERVIWVEMSWQAIYDKKGNSQGYRASIRDITNRKEAEQEVRQSRQMLQSVLDTIPVRVFWKDRDSVYIGCNRLFAEDGGFESPDEIVGKNDYEVGWNDRADLYRADDRYVIETGNAKLGYEELQTTPDGRQIWLLTSKIPLTDVDDNIVGVLGTYEDITDRKKSRDALRESEERLRDFFRNAPVGFHIFGPDRVITDVNEAELAMIGYDRDEIVGKKTWADLIVAEQKEQYEKHWQDMNTSGDVRNLEYTLVHKDGHRVDVILNASSRFDASGKLVNTRGSVLNITERKQAEEALRLVVEGTSRATGEEFFRCLVESLAGAFGFRYAFVGRVVSPKRDEIDTVAVWAGEGFAENFKYELAGTPCQFVVGQKTCFFPKEVQREFPEDHLLVDLGVESYLGIPLFDSFGNALGLLAVMHDEAMKPLPHAEAIMTIFASRAAAEIERAMVSRALADSEKKFRSVVETATDAMISADSCGDITFWNPAAEKMFGYSRDEVLGKPLTTIMPEQYHNSHIKGLNRVVTTGKSRLEGRVVELSGLRKDGSEFPLSLSIASWATEEGMFFTAILRDITDRKGAEEELLKEKILSETVINSLPGVFYLCDEEGNLVQWNTNYEEITGYSSDELAEMKGPDFFAADEREAMVEKVREVMGSGMTASAEANILSKSGRKIPYYFTGLRMMLGGRPYLAGMGFDLTERKQVEEALRTSEANYREIYNSVNDLISVHDTDTGEMVDVNERMCETLGYTHEEMCGMSVEVITAPVPPYTQENAMKRMKKAAAGNPQLFEWLCRDRDGRHIWVEVSLKRAEIGGKTRVLAVVRDVSERKRAVEELREREERYRELVEMMNEGLGLTDADYNFTYVNKRLAEMLCYTPEEMIGHHITEFQDEQSRKLMKEQMARRRKGDAEPYDITWRAKDGRKVYTIASPRGIFDSEGNFTGSFAVLTDITERRHADRERARLAHTLAVKNKELESILYVASHDLRSSLVNIQGFSHELSDSCDLLRSSLKDTGIVDDKVKKARTALDVSIPSAMSFILTSANRIDSLLSGLLRLSRLGRAAVSIERLDMNAMMSSIAASMEYQAKQAHVKVKIDSLPACLGDASLINQVFSNLLDNALKYLDETRPGLVKIYGKVDVGQSVYCVEDNGIGITAGHQGKIFEVFHRLEPDKKSGEGLGLTIVRRILDRHDGRVWIESELGQGSKFFVSLPSV